MYFKYYFYVLFVALDCNRGIKKFIDIVFYLVTVVKIYYLAAT